MPKKKACNKKLKFEDCIELIDREISKRKNKWTLTSIAWMDFDDISQILKIHIFKKWHLYDETKPLAPWLNRIISNQLKNLIRNNYSNYCKPCLKCAASEPDSACSIYGTQDGRCPLFKSWLQKKKPAYDVKMALPLENHKEQINETEVSSANIELGIQKLNFKLKEILKPNEWIVYEGFYIHNKTEQEIAETLNFKTTEKNRTPGYKQIKNIQKSIITKARKILEKNDLDWI
jgi:hypothetical protein|tara:strand:- start:374 stop:1072 length:699 start_codon:yes stop_codon:yes gene_type:complete